MLSGSANCTQPALGVRGRPGVNAEASVYRRTARDVAVSALDLNGLVSGPTLAVATLPVAARPAPIPLQANAGSAAWAFRGRAWRAALGVRHRVHGRALSHFSMAMVSRSGVLDIAAMTGSGETRTARRDDLDKVRFIRIENARRSRQWLLLAIAVSCGRFEWRRPRAPPCRLPPNLPGSSDLQLFLIEALDELMRADVEATSTPTSTLRLRRGQSANGAEVEAESKILSYADFVALKPQNRQASGGESSIAGMHVDPVRALLNRLSGGRSDKVEEDGGDVSWMELSDEYADSMPNATHPDPDASPKLEFDRNAFIKAAERYQAHIATVGSEPSPIAAKSCVCGSGLCCWLTHWTKRGAA